MSKRFGVLVAAGVLVLVIGAFFATMTFAADTPQQPSGTPQALVQEFFDKLASKLGISSSQLQQAVTSTEDDIINEQVQQGKITQQQGDALKQKIDQGPSSEGFPLGGLFKGEGFGRGGFMGANISDLSTFFGITTQQLQTELQSGKTLAQIATEHGKTADQLKTYITDQVKAQLDKAVASGSMTQQQEDNVLSQIGQKLDAMINGQANFGLGMHVRGRFHGGQNNNPAPAPTPNTSSGGASL